MSEITVSEISMPEVFPLKAMCSIFFNRMFVSFTRSFISEEILFEPIKKLTETIIDMVAKIKVIKKFVSKLNF